MTNAYLEKVASMSEKDLSNHYLALSGVSGAATAGGLAYGYKKRVDLGKRVQKISGKAATYVHSAKGLTAQANRSSRFLSALDKIQEADSKIKGRMAFGGRLGGAIAASSALGAYGLRKSHEKKLAATE